MGSVYLQRPRLADVILCQPENRFLFAVYAASRTFRLPEFPAKNAVTWPPFPHQNRAKIVLDKVPVNVRNLRS
jgi:hypothetical protein